MSIDKLPFQPVNRTSLSNASGGCALSKQGCVIAGSMLALLLFVILAGAGIAVYFLKSNTIAAAADTPVVAITAPTNRSEVMLQTPVMVWATASAAGGITRMELWESGQQINGVTVAEQQALPQLRASFQWWPTTPGQHTLEVRVYGRSDDISASTLVVVNVVDKRPLPPGGPVGQTRLTTKTSLTARAGPGESFAAVGTLPAGTTVTALERSADQQWWQILFEPAGTSQSWIPADAESVMVAGGDNLELQSVVPTATATPVVTATETPVNTATPTPMPTSTPVPVSTVAPPEQGSLSGPPGQASDGGPGGGQPGLPAEAITACSGLSEGDTCTSSGPMGSMSGTCTTIDSQLACMPEGGPPGAP